MSLFILTDSLNIINLWDILIIHSNQLNAHIMKVLRNFFDRLTRRNEIAFYLNISHKQVKPTPFSVGVYRQRMRAVAISEDIRLKFKTEFSKDTPNILYLSSRSQNPRTFFLCENNFIDGTALIMDLTDFEYYALELQPETEIVSVTLFNVTRYDILK